MLAYITLPVLYLLVRKHINRAHEALSEYRPICEAHPPPQPCAPASTWAAVADKKLVLIPLVFICLRIWGTVRFVLTLCGSPLVRAPALVLLHGVGNTFQGGANCILFVLGTRAIRERLFALCCCCLQPSTPSPANHLKVSTSSMLGDPQDSGEAVHS
ncbi:G-protein coupled receptor 157 [Octodon degus]|uniref:G-protein coupled receptor 157 n=1 Tax=Octodon degus TaxID=10160 RepID=A0A6P6D5H9_OCTDE|nr:G-protein coupled receptor 157 [Octodon degus]